ncbi:hypothetical protein BRC83_01215 [Halobacteriales archaeon QS_1_68_17]|nr:MAG: hypothetical protein BRC83_01215 [Halobacteriales archaeon QS_1_68_17]
MLPSRGGRGNYLSVRAVHNGRQIALGEPADADGRIVATFADVKPCDTGCVSLGVHNDTNPAWAWLAMDVTADEDGGDGDGEPTPTPDRCFEAGKLERYDGDRFTTVEGGGRGSRTTGTN